jgi:NADH:ubiquinone oxidoreductase subunit 4 (subunit M)
MSIFLSCILIKVCLYGLIRTFSLVGGLVPFLPFVFFIGLGVFDVASRLINQVDLKAITAYGSVLHVNLLMLIFLFDTSSLSLGFVIYI